MIIKVWNNHDWKVFKVMPVLGRFAEDIKSAFNKEEKRQLRKMAKIFAEETALEFVHNLKKGWENKVLKNGNVLSKSNNKVLKTKEEIQRALGSDGEIIFHSHKKNSSVLFIKKIKKPAYLCWD